MKNRGKRNVAEVAERRMQSRRQLLAALGIGVGGVAAAFLLLGTGSALRMNKSAPSAVPSSGMITFDNARSTHSLRQQFLDQLVSTNQIPYCTGVVYDHDGSKIQAYFQSVGATEFIGGKASVFHNGNYDIKTPDVLNRAGQGHAVPIFVGRQPFEANSFSYMNAEDLRHIIVAHEGQHCQQHAKGLPYLSPSETLAGLQEGKIHPIFLYHIGEHDAYLHDLPRLLRGEFKASEYHINDAKQRFIQNGLNLTKASRVARPLELRLFYGVMDAVQKEPLLHDISVPSSFYEQKKRFK